MGYWKLVGVVGFACFYLLGPYPVTMLNVCKQVSSNTYLLLSSTYLLLHPVFRVRGSSFSRASRPTRKVHFPSLYGIFYTPALFLLLRGFTVPVSSTLRHSRWVS